MAKILIVEDNPMNMELIVDILGFAGHESYQAFDGKKALDTVENNNIDLILLDMQLPEMDGLEVLSRLKDNSKTSDIPVIAVTAHAMIGDKERFLEAGCVDYIAKPIDITIFTDLIEKHLN